jgi:hypothetical protein
MNFDKKMLDIGGFIGVSFCLTACFGDGSSGWRGIFGGLHKVFCEQ